MSRTDKDRPYWVKTNDPHENRYIWHDHRPRVIRCISGEREVEWTSYDYMTGKYRVAGTRTERTFYRGSIPVECDLAPTPKSKRERRGARCSYEVLGPDYRKYWQGSPPKWWADMMNHNPMRRDSRDVLREVVKEYNSNGECDDPELYTPHRHTGWWD